MRRTIKLSLLLVVLLGVLFALLLSASVYSYHRLTAETLIAELRFDATGNRSYAAHLRTGDRCTERTLPIIGDQWRIDAEFLKWKYWALLLGLDSQYRLDRLEGRYRTAAEQNTGPNIAHDLREPNAIDLVALAASLSDFNFLLDASYGSSTYEDIDTARVYRVYRTQTGLLTRSAPRAAEHDGGEPLAVDVTAACGARPPLWRRAADWTDARIVDLLAWLPP